MVRILLLLALSYIVESTNGVFNSHSSQKVRVKQHDADGPGSPLFLTPYIESGRIEEAKNLSRVHFPGIPEIESYAGFFTVDKKYDSNQYLWYFPSTSNSTDKPMMLWLQGGPEISSLHGLFCENGPFAVNETKKSTFYRRKVHWAELYNIIYIDNPVGAGFSFTNDTRGYCTNQTQIAEHLYTTLIQFFQLFPELQKNYFLMAGQSYAGKYIPALGYTIHHKNPTAKIKINLKGLVIGHGWCDPIHQLHYSDYLYQLGLFDWYSQSLAEDYQNKIIELIKKEEWEKGYELYLNFTNNFEMAIGKLINPENYFEIDSLTCSYFELLENATIRRAMHVGNLTHAGEMSSTSKLNEFTKKDYLQSVAPWISELLDHYPILFYSGQQSVIMPYPLTVNFLKHLNFSAHEEYLTAERFFLVMQDDFGKITQIGYIKPAGNLTEVLLRDAGYRVAVDQPEWLLGTIDFWFGAVAVPFNSILIRTIGQ